VASNGSESFRGSDFPVEAAKLIDAPQPAQTIPSKEVMTATFLRAPAHVY
jgi:hypothetical protein